MNSMLSRSLNLGLAGFALATLASAYSIPVTSNADSGGGTFREAIESANGDNSVDSIVFDSGLGTIALDTTVEYAGAQGLTIFGNDATISGGGAYDLFRSSGGGDLWIRNLTFDGSGEEGIEVDLPSGATGEIRTSLYRVTVSNSAANGVLIEDQVDNSDAGVVFELLHSTISDNGTASASINYDQDGVRINEGGLGGIRADIAWSTVTGNKYDGIEFDEKGEGDVWASAANCQFNENGFGFPGDLEDGFDIDEADAGNVFVALPYSTANDNAEDGFDHNEAGEGDITVNGNRSTATGNGSRGQDVEEEDGGSIFFHAQDSTYSDNTGDGIRNSENGDGNLTSRLLRTKVQGNDDDGIDAEESKSDAGTGTGLLRIQKGTVVSGNAKNFELDNVVQVNK